MNTSLTSLVTDFLFLFFESMLPNALEHPDQMNGKSVIPLQHAGQLVLSQGKGVLVSSTDIFVLE